MQPCIPFQTIFVSSNATAPLNQQSLKWHVSDLRVYLRILLKVLIPEMDLQKFGIHVMPRNLYSK